MIYQNGAVWKDTDGNPIQAHSGWMLFHGGFWYWYGEDRRGSSYISCYRSPDLENWEFRRSVLHADSPKKMTRVRSDMRLTAEAQQNMPGVGSNLMRCSPGKVDIERPKVLYNAKTEKYVMWAHWEDGMDYRLARCAVATCDTPDGEFIYHGSFNPYGYESRDCTVWQEPDGTAYFISSTRNNADTHIYRLSEDYLNVETLVSRLWQGEYREAHAVAEKGGKYYLFSSACAGYYANQCKFGMSDSMEKVFGLLQNIGDESAFNSQAAFVLQMDTTAGRQYLYVGDRWCEASYCDSGYVMLLIRFDENGMPYMTWNERFSLDSTNGYKAL